MAHGCYKALGLHENSHVSHAQMIYALRPLAQKCYRRVLCWSAARRNGLVFESLAMQHQIHQKQIWKPIEIHVKTVLVRDTETLVLVKFKHDVQTQLASCRFDFVPPIRHLTPLPSLTLTMSYGRSITPILVQLSVAMLITQSLYLDVWR